MPALRHLLPALKNKAYFNYGGQGPLPSPSLERIKASWQTIQELGPFSNDVWPYIASEIQKTRQKLAEMSGVSPGRICLTENVTSGCVLPLWGLPLKENDRLLISDCEHPGVIAACHELSRRKNLAIDQLPVSKLKKGIDEQDKTVTSLLDTLKKHLTPNTRLVVISHILWNTGQLLPIDSIAEILSSHPKRPFLLVDAAQSFGQIPIKTAAESADIYAFTGHKWACGPEGLGGVVLSERVLAESSPTLIGWRGLQHEGSFKEISPTTFHKDSRKFEVATSCIPLLAGLRCSIELLEEEGSITKRLARIRELSSKLWINLQNLESIEPLLTGPPPSGLVSFYIPEGPHPKKVVKDLGKKGIWIRDLDEPICLRACLHISSNENDIDKLLEGINFIQKSGK